MKKFCVGLAASVLLVGLGIYFAAKHPSTLPASPPLTATAIRSVDPSPEPEAALPDTPPSPPRPTSTAEDSPVKPARPAYARITIKPGQPIPELFPHQAERDRLLNLAATQDASQIPVIAVALRHSDASVRAAARQALIQLGDAAAVPHLEAAAKEAKAPEEAELLHEAVEFLSLPRFMDLIMRASKTTAP